MRGGFLLGAGLGAGMMYVLDPRQGRRRRALARDKVVSALKRADHAIGAKARDMANRARGMLGTGAGRRAVDVQKTIDIAAPVETVFGFWQRYDKFPGFMSNVREVRDLGGGRSRWTVAGPAGVPVEWDAEITQIVPDKLIAWKTLPGATVEHAGIVRFAPNADGTTTVAVRLSYDPPAGAVGQTVATLFGADPKSELDADLARMKSLIETGRAETHVH